MTDSLGGALSPLQMLLDMLDPDKKQWLQSQPQEKQEQLAKDFMNSSGGVSFGNSSTALTADSVLNPGKNDKANQFIQLAQMSQ